MQKLNRVIVYIIRFLLALTFIYAGFEKIFLEFDPESFRVRLVDTAEGFFVFYELLHHSGFLYFVGFFQLLCGVLFVFKRTYLLASIMLVPILLCLLMTQYLLARELNHTLYDIFLLLITVFLIGNRFKDWRAILNQQSTII